MRYIDPAIATDVLGYTTSVSAFACPFIWSRLLSKFFNNQDMAHYASMSSTIGALSSPIWHIQLLPRYGIRGAAAAYGMGFLVETACSLFFLIYSSHTRHTIHQGHLRPILRWSGVREYMFYGLSAMLYVLGDGVIFDFVIFITGTHG